MRDVREACEPTDLAAFGTALFEQWRQHGAPPAERWAVAALAHLGADTDLERLLERRALQALEAAHRGALEAPGAQVVVRRGLEVVPLEREAPGVAHPPLVDLVVVARAHALHGARAA